MRPTLGVRRDRQTPGTDHPVAPGELPGVIGRLTGRGYDEVAVVIADDPLGRMLTARLGWPTGSVGTFRPARPGPPHWRPGQHAATAPTPSFVVSDRRIALLQTARATPDAAGKLITEAVHLSTLTVLFRVLAGATRPVPPPERRIPDRAYSILRLLADGLTDEAVAARLGIAARTVRREVNTLMQNCGAESRFQLALRAKELNWMRPAGETDEPPPLTLPGGRN